MRAIIAWGILQIPYYASEPDGNWTRQLVDLFLGASSETRVNGEITEYSQVGLNAMGIIVAALAARSLTRLDLWRAPRPSIPMPNRGPGSMESTSRRRGVHASITPARPTRVKCKPTPPATIVRPFTRTPDGGFLHAPGDDNAAQRTGLVAHAANLVTRRTYTGTGGLP
jgi:hypothetical protein